MPPLKIAIIGLGTVGTGVARILLDDPVRNGQRAGRPLELSQVVVRQLDKPRDIDLPPNLITDDVQSVINQSRY